MRNIKHFIKSALLILICYNTADAQILVSGTSFEPSAGNEGRAYIGTEDIIQYGLQPGSFSLVAEIAPDAETNTFDSDYYYGITDSYIKLDDDRYSDLTGSEDYALVVSPYRGGNNNENILEYTVSGLEPGANWSVEVDYCSAVDPAYSSCGPGERVSLRGVGNPDQYNLMNGTEASQLSMGACGSVTYTQGSNNSNVVTADGKLVFRLNTQQKNNCKAIAITNIEVYSTPLPVIYSPDGDEVCAGEQISIQTTQAYNADYQWQVDDGSGWSDISGATSEALLFEMTNIQDYDFRLELTPIGGGSPITSEPVTVTAVTCCEINGVPASRQTIYLDDFGRIDPTDVSGLTYYEWDYSDILNPVEVQKTANAAFRWALDPSPYPDLGNPATFQGTGPLQDGQYAIAGLMTGYNPATIDGTVYQGARLEWASHVTGPTNQPQGEPRGLDHSGDPFGAALLINNPPNTGGEVVYRRNINNLCFGKQLFFETWITVFTSDAPGAYNAVNITLKATDSQAPANVVEVTASATNQSEGGGVWVKLSGEITLQQANSELIFEIINNVNTDQNGNDLVIDDIKIMACSPPSLNAFFDLNTLSTEEEACASPLTIEASASALLGTYYSNPQYLFQWTTTPNDFTSWTNLGPPQSSTAFTIAIPKDDPSFAGLVDGDKVYYRVIAGTSSIYSANSNFTAPNHANINDPCKNYSVSEPIEATVNCPSCTTPTSLTVTFDGSTVADGGDITVCEGTAVTVDIDAEWPTPESGATETDFEMYAITPVPVTQSLETFDGTAVTTGSGQFSIISNFVLPTISGTYIVGIQNTSGCKLEQDIELNVTATPSTPTVTSPQEFCEDASASLITPTVGGGNTLLWYTGPSGGSGSSTTPSITTTTPGSPIATHYVSERTSAATGNCEGERAEIVVNVTPKPATPGAISIPSTICTGGNNYAVSIDAINGADDYTWSYSGTGITFSGSTESETFNVASNATEGNITVTANNSCGSSTEQTAAVSLGQGVSITSQPAGSTVCSGSDITLDVTATGTAPLAFQWKQGTTDIGINSNSHTISGIDNTTDGDYTVEISNACGTITSDIATIALNPALSITTAPSNLTECEETNQSLSVVATGSGTLSFAWTKDGNPIGGDANSIDFSPLAIADEGSYAVTVTDECTSSTSTSATVTVNEEVSITVQPSPASGCVGSSSSLSISATGTGPINYAWTKLPSTSVGTNNSSLDFPSLTLSDDGDYQVSASNNCGTVTSETTTVSITENETPSVSLGVDTRSICSGETVDLTASGQGMGSAPTFTFSEPSLGTIGSASQTTNTTTTANLMNTGETPLLLEFEVEMTSNTACPAPGAALVVKDTIHVYVDAPSLTAIINEADQVICTDGIQLSSSTVPAEYTGTWSKGTGNSGSIDANGLTSGIAKDDAVEFIYTVSTPLGVCTDDATSITLTRAGDITNPNGVNTQSTSLCDNESAPSLNGLTLKGTETATWTATAPATIDGSGQTDNLQLGDNIFTYEISDPSSGCAPQSATVTIEIVAAPLFSLVTPTDDPGKTGTETISVEITDPGTGYIIDWTTSGEGTVDDNSAVSTQITGLVTTDLITDVSVSVVDENNICEAVTIDFQVERVAQTIPNLGSDITLCQSDFTTQSIPLPSLIAGIESESITLDETGFASIVGRSIEVANIPGPGTFNIVYEVDNQFNGISRDTIALIIDEAPGNVSITNDLIPTCQSQINLTAATPTPASAVGTWIITTEPSGQIASLDDNNNPTALISGLIQGQTIIEWSVTNGLCTSSTVSQTINQVGQITDPTISIEGQEISGTTYDMCLGDISVVIESNTTLTSNETGEWTAGFSGNSSTQVYAPIATGSETITWSISTSVPGCNSAEKSVTINTFDTPKGGAINPQQGCEGTDITFEVTGVTDATTYNWVANSGATLNSSTDNQAVFTLSTDGSTLAEVQVTPSNSCGTGTFVVGSATIDLKPRETPVITANSGEFAVCATKSDSYSVSSSDASSYSWFWNNEDKGTNTTNDLNLNSSDFSNLSSGTITVTGINACGEGVSHSETVTIITPDIIDISLLSDASDNKFCVEEDVVSFTASSTSGTLGGLIPEYRFLIGSSEAQGQGTSNTFSASIGQLNDESSVTVEITGDPEGCYTSNTNSTFITMNGYNQPNITLNSTSSSICESHGEITLNVTGLAKGDAVTDWTLDGNSLLLSSTSVSASSADDRGLYEVFVSNEICELNDSETMDIMVFEQPTIDEYSFLENNRLVIYIESEGQSIAETYPVSISGLSLDNSETYKWTTESMSVEDSRDFTITAAGETVGDEYVYLTVTNGSCKDSSGFYATITLPLEIPTAFSPNGDIINDTWIIQGMNRYPDATVSIFNRWGILLYQTYGGYTTEKAWNGDEMPVGTYYYTLKLNQTGDLTEQQQIEEEQSGYFELIR